MNIGKNIREIRTKNNMSQEEFGKLFYVTRQTVSNWENEKSFPDLKTIVDISDKFDISLDKLLKEDKEMVETITNNVRIAEKWNKYKRTVAMVSGAVITASIISAGVYGTVWNIKRTKLENNFNSAVTEMGFMESDKRTYLRSDSSGIEYELPRQKMPSPLDFSLDFHAKYVYAHFTGSSQDFTLLNIENEAFDIVLEDYPEEGRNSHISIDKNGLPLENDKLTDEQAKLINDNSEKIKTALSDSIKIYDRAYL
ncbi:MAG: helix-turn-helix transcriptional regulator [Ruminococcus sp.]|nr:helix-turn-helix transcriptional regulator [Ruminococcus sp.]